VTDISGIVVGNSMLEVLGPGDSRLLSSYAGSLAAGALVGPEALRLLSLSPAENAAATETLSRGGLVVPADDPSLTGPVSVRLADGFDAPPSASYTGPALRVHVRGGTAATPAVLSPAVAGHVSVERGYDGRGKRTAILVLAAAAAALMLGGTLGAALLALSDAKPDFSTLMSVGASPRVRRKVAAAYAGVIGLLGSVLGALAGFVPGIAISYPLTRDTQTAGGPSHYLTIPWLLVLGLTIGVPLVAAGGAALLTRSRLPLASRLEV
jgi:putative ABC transport system permease protein